MFLNLKPGSLSSRLRAIQATRRGLYILVHLGLRLNSRRGNAGEGYVLRRVSPHLLEDLARSQGVPTLDLDPAAMIESSGDDRTDCLYVLAKSDYESEGFDQRLDRLHHLLRRVVPVFEVDTYGRLLLSQLRRGHGNHWSCGSLRWRLFSQSD